MRLPARLRIVSRATRYGQQARCFSGGLKSRASVTRASLSNLWVPTGGVAAAEVETGHDKLIRAGFLRQSQSGIFQLLPLGLRVQDKIERLLDKHMQSIGASRLSLSSFTTEGLWRKSGRLENVSSELFHLTDRRDARLLLSPTHEEEITTLVAGVVKSYKDLPLRLYQITRKYRDEIRPRQGLLRSREFLMKDLYTFDLTREAAEKTYQDVANAYRSFFADLRLPVLVAEASSGAMGGDHSHEYHLANKIGEDDVVTCSSCAYTANDEVALAKAPSVTEPQDTPGISDFAVWRGISQDRGVLINAWYPSADEGKLSSGVNMHALKKEIPDLDTSISQSGDIWTEILSRAEAQLNAPPKLINVVDARLHSVFQNLQADLPMIPPEIEGRHPTRHYVMQPTVRADINLLPVANGDDCPRCGNGKLRVDRALELGHTFYLGTRYSIPLAATFSFPSTPAEKSPIEMGCYGIGVSRILATVAEHYNDSKGLKWPRSIAPYEVVVIPTSGVTDDALDFFDNLAEANRERRGLDMILDDRKQSFGWKMRDADTIGYPVSIILGKNWKEKGVCEVQCRNLGTRQHVAIDTVSQYLTELLESL